MNSFSSSPSLIPYLLPSGKPFYLALSRNKTIEGKEDGRFPFLVISGSGPFASILEASVVTDALSPIQKAFLLIQKDEYPLLNDLLRPISNKEIDRAWKDSFAFLRRQHPHPPIMVLKDQMDESENLLAWRPLFYCSKRDLFFHPWCPTCGLFLDRCSDDDILIGVGLQGYSNSLKRYLFCPHCHHTGGKSEFYIHAKDVHDPPILKDQSDLIRGFGTRVSSKSHDENGPCQDCPFYSECYGPGNMAFSRIVSLSFYPFFMLLHSAPSLPLFDFLPLLSGESFEDRARKLRTEGEMGRLGCLDRLQESSERSLFFFVEDERFFLEVLYLKLSLLGELALMVFSNQEKWRYPELGLSMDRLWISIAKQGPLLPFFWNFSLHSLGVGLDSEVRPGFPKLPPNYGLYLLSSAWFYILLANRRQQAVMIYEEAARALEKISLEGETGSLDLLMDHPDGVFAPENIFWEPEDKAVHSAWKALWWDSLKIGFRLLIQSRGETLEWSEDTFWRELGSLRKETKNSLFQLAPLQTSEPMVADKRIHQILSRIAEKWQRSQKVVAPEESKPPKIAHEESDAIDDIVIKETVILSPQEFAKERYSLETVGEKMQEGGKFPPPPPHVPIPTQSLRKQELDLPETIIVKRESNEDVNSPSPQPSDPDIPETLIISSKKTPGTSFGAEHPKSEERGNAERKTLNSSLEKARGGPEGEAGKKKELQDDVPETIIIRKEK